MWLLEGRFAEDSRQESSKLLKYGQTYVLGRKIPADIVVDSKFVSRTSCHISIGSEPAAAALISDPIAFHHDLTLRPTVTIRFEANKSRKTFGVLSRPRTATSTTDTAEGEPTEVQIPANQEHELKDGDSFALTTTISLRLTWKPFAVCFAARIKESSIAPLRPSASSLGIFLSPAKSRWKNGFTHLCLQQIKPTESVIGALIQARPILNLDYFVQLIPRANLPRHDPDSLETKFAHLDYAAYQPEISQSDFSDIPELSSRLQPEEKRTYMLKGTTCVFFVLPSDDNEFTIYKNILTLAGARVFHHNPVAENLTTKAHYAHLLMPYKNNALSYWRNSGSKPRSEAPDEGLVVIVSSMHDETPWKKACAVACTNLRIAMAPGFHAITNAIFSADVRTHLNIIPNVADDAAVLKSLPSPTPHTDADVTRTEEEAPPAAHREDPEKTMRPTTSALAQEHPREPSLGPPGAVLVEETNHFATAPSLDTSTSQTRRPLKRRTQQTASAGSRTDLPGDRDHEANPGQQAESSRDNNDAGTLGFSVEGSSQIQPSQASRATSSRLTRRTGADRAATRRSDIFDALLRGNPESSAAMSADARPPADAQCTEATQSSASSAVPRSRRYRMDLDAEDQAQTQPQSQAAELQLDEDQTQAGRKRKQAEQDASMEVEDQDRVEAAKRPRRPNSEDEVDQARVNHLDPDGDDAVPSSSNHVIRRESSEHAAGLQAGAQPDTEPQFLQALNTQRAKGKRMDEFDADFNRLRIAKPNQLTDREAAKTSSSFPTANANTNGNARRQQQQSQMADRRPVDEDYEAFKRMAEEELRIHARGNFVQVDFVPLIRKKTLNETTQASTVELRHAGVPNFKKFRPKPKSGHSPINESLGATPSTRPKVALALTETNDYGLGKAYWNDIRGSQDAEADDRGGRRRPRSAGFNLTLSEDSDSEGATGSGFGFGARARARARGRGTRPTNAAEAEPPEEQDELDSSRAVDLRLDGLDSMDDLDDEADMTTLLARRNAVSTRTQPRKRGTKRPALLAVNSDDNDEDDDDGGELDNRGGSASTMRSGNAGRASKKIALAVDSDENFTHGHDDDEDDDDDNDGNFAGFGKSTSTRSSRRRAAPSQSASIRRSARSGF